MNHEECRRILNLPADASAEVIRQAYLDLARVWHPDRFQSDERLRSIAEDHIREVNEAYATLRNYQCAQAGSTAGPPPAQQPPVQPHPAHARQAGPPVWTCPPEFRRPASRALLSRSISNKVAYPTIVAALLALPFVAVSQLPSMLRVPRLDTHLIPSGAFQTGILNPMAVIDPHRDVRGAADVLTRWARGDELETWKPAPQAASAPAPRYGAARRPSVPTPHEAPPQNGAELIPVISHSGAGELHVSNHTGLEAVFKLVSQRRMNRAVYVAPKGSVTLRSIPVGVYELYVDLGNNLDVEHIKFQSDHKTPTPMGPFQFQEITSDTGVSGNRYDVVLNGQ